MIGGCGFTASCPLPPALDWVCYLCFIGFWVPAIPGAILLLLSRKGDETPPVIAAASNFSEDSPGAVPMDLMCARRARHESIGESARYLAAGLLLEYPAGLSGPGPARRPAWRTRRHGLAGSGPSPAV